MSSIILTGGGTGGHVYPNLAMLDLLRKKFDDIYYFGVGGIDEELATQKGLKFFKTDFVKFDRKNIFKNLSIPKKLEIATKKAAIMIRDLNPSVVLSKGGYASLPTALAALRLGIPVVCYESDVTLGLANRYARMKGAVMAYANKESAVKYHGEFTGIPLRKELFSINRFDAREKLGLTKKTVLVIGGSSGAVSINEVARFLPEKLGGKFCIIHVCGKGKSKGISGDDYTEIEYVHDMPTYLAAADVIVSRCGATSLNEIAALRKKAVFIPLPKGTSRGDQVLNAEVAKRHGGIILPQSELNANTLAKCIMNADTPMTPLCMSPNEKLLSLIMKQIR